MLSWRARWWRSRADVGQLARLLGDGLDDARVLVAEVDAHQLRGEVEVALAGAVGELAALGVDDVQRLPGLLEAPGAVVGLARDGGDLFGCESLKLGCFGHGRHLHGNFNRLSPLPRG